MGVILTSPPYWMSDRGRAAADRYARSLAVDLGREWRRVLAPDGDVWLVVGDRHDGREWIGVERDPGMAHLAARRLKMARSCR